MLSFQTFVVALLAFNWVVNAEDNQCDFKCGDGKCISAFWHCDNIKDCSDGSDEVNCNYLHQCNQGEFMCMSGECIKANMKCDGKADCSDGSDERGCLQQREQDINLPSADDFEHGMAHHEIKGTLALSVTTPASLLSSASSCSQKNASLYFTNGDSSIHRLRIDGLSNELKLVVEGDLATRDPITSLSYKRDDGLLLFVTKRENNHIHAMDTSGEVKTFAKHDSEHFGRVAVDPLTNNVYFMEDGYGIGVCNEKADKCVTLINATSHEHRFKNLILHPRRGLMFWIEYEPTPIVKVAGMDGKNPRHLGLFTNVHALAMDAENEMLFVADENDIVRLDFRELAQTHFASIRAAAISYFNCELYYVQRDVPTLRVLSNQKDREIRSLAGSSFILALVPDNEKNVQIENPCLEAKCPELCVLVDSAIGPQAKCLCKVCSDTLIVEATSSAFSTFLTVSLILLLLTLIGMFLVVYFRLWPALCDRLDRLLGLNNAHNTSNISVGFSNSELK